MRTKIRIVVFGIIFAIEIVLLAMSAQAPYSWVQKEYLLVAASFLPLATAAIYLLEPGVAKLKEIVLPPPPTTPPPPPKPVATTPPPPKVAIKPPTVTPKLIPFVKKKPVATSPIAPKPAAPTPPPPPQPVPKKEEIIDIKVLFSQLKGMKYTLVGWWPLGWSRVVASPDHPAQFWKLDRGKPVVGVFMGYDNEARKYVAWTGKIENGVFVEIKESARADHEEDLLKQVKEIMEKTDLESKQPQETKPTPQK